MLSPKAVLRIFFQISGLLLVAAVASTVQATTVTVPERDQCDTAADLAAEEYGLPKNLLRALTRTETGRPMDGALVPWPWTLNVAGDGQWFRSRTDALDALRMARASGTTSIDVGCFQINLKWHGRHFSTDHEMLEPLANARYAARFLRSLHAELSDWDLAVGAFHSRTERHAAPYLARLKKIRRNLKKTPEPLHALAERSTNTRASAFPLLRPPAENSVTASASLVSLGTSARPFWSLSGDQR
ncbi:lytic transglycosylase domain-containing protein [Litorisediminicola beolgyonensis]|uniref:Lytic transglycosylase domain-containing protein n=1 Tax=Litorisediminicola beolgyonensis TaxID=1173614 RepID=A0ABW3ZGA8_9RHOB